MFTQKKMEKTEGKQGQVTVARLQLGQQKRLSSENEAGNKLDRWVVVVRLTVTVRERSGGAGTGRENGCSGGTDTGRWEEGLKWWD